MNLMKSSSNCEQDDGKKHNETTEHIKVVVRVRPRNDNKTTSHNIVHVVDTNLLIFDPKEETDFYFQGRRHITRDFTRRINRDTKFVFDYVFDEVSSNANVFEHTTKDMISGLLNGLNCSVFAYGATGAGKTYTMLGSSHSPGIVFKTVMELYHRIEEIQEEKTCEINVSYLEVYNETVRDLLQQSKPLEIREDRERGVVIPGLSFHRPNGAEHLLDMLQQGNSNRTQHPTDANAESSRSHAVFQIYVQQKDRTADLSTVVRVAKMSLIDLAGSEKAKVTLGAAARLREGANINKSLLALANCINALADRKNKNSHVPYRNSKLTRILKDSLGGNCRTVMIAAISSSLENYDDTYNTLKYADRAKAIQINLNRNVVSVNAHVGNYAKIVEDLRHEVTRLKEKLQMYESQSCNDISSKSISVSKIVEEEEEKWCERIKHVFDRRIALRRDIMECNATLQQLQAKMYLRYLGMDLFSLLCYDQDQVNKSTVKRDAAIKSLLIRQNHNKAKKLEYEKLYEKNTTEIKELEKELHSLSDNGQIRKRMFDYLQYQCLLLEKEEFIQQEKHSKEIILLQEKELIKSERLLKRLVNLLRCEHLILTGHNYMTTNLMGEYDMILREITGVKEVAWADQDEKCTSFRLRDLVDITNMTSESLKPLFVHNPLRGIENIPSCNEFQKCQDAFGNRPNCSPNPIILKRHREDEETCGKKPKIFSKRSLNETFCKDVPHPSIELATPLPPMPLLGEENELLSTDKNYIQMSPHSNRIQNQTFTASPTLYLNCTFTPQLSQNWNVSASLPSYPLHPVNQLNRQILGEIQNTPQKSTLLEYTPSQTNLTIKDSVTKKKESTQSTGYKSGTTGYRILDKILKHNATVDLNSLRNPCSSKKSPSTSKCHPPRHRKSHTENSIRFPLRVHEKKRPRRSSVDGNPLRNSCKKMLELTKLHSLPNRKVLSSDNRYARKNISSTNLTTQSNRKPVIVKRPTRNNPVWK